MLQLVIQTNHLFNDAVLFLSLDDEAVFTFFKSQLYAPVRQIFCMIGHYCNQALIAVMVVIKKLFKESSHLIFYLCLLYTFVVK